MFKTEEESAQPTKPCTTWLSFFNYPTIFTYTWPVSLNGFYTRPSKKANKAHGGVNTHELIKQFTAHVPKVSVGGVLFFLSF